ncbi:MAG: T9SS type A sorting domain-containing protein [Saprospiraceae bacterium]
MKRLFTALFLCLGFSTLISAQTSFSVSDLEVWEIVPLNATDVEGHFTITNLTNTTQTIRWTRIVVDTTSGCETQVCDINLCYLPFVSTRTFDLTGNSTGNIIMHFLNPDSIVGASGVIRLKMTNENIPADSVTVTFLFTPSTSSTDNPLPAATVKVYPNPTTDYFLLENAEAVQRIRLFSLDNREVANFAANPAERYSLAGQPAGTYILVLEDEQGRTFQAAELVKR